MNFQDARGALKQVTLLFSLGSLTLKMTKQLKKKIKKQTKKKNDETDVSLLHFISTVTRLLRPSHPRPEAEAKDFIGI